ncbi:MAG: hypothetical protein IPL53_02775 [Ignavibacteria bacterium]|nr:hypothetical protein [Ignavibacteria bacterium]
MFTNNLTELLKTFSAKETKEFREFLNSSYFNKRQAVSNLYEIIIKFHPDFENKALTKQNIFNKLFPGKKYNDSSLRVLTHYLTDLAQKYLAHKRFETNKLEFKVQLDQELTERKQNKLFEKNLTGAFDILKKADIESEEYFYYKYRLVNDRTYHQYVSNYANYEKIIDRSDWENVFKDFKNFYLVKFMIMYLNTMNFYALYNKKLKSEVFEKEFDKIRIADFEDIAVLKMYYYMIKMNTESSHSEYYFKLKDILLKNKVNLNKFDLIGAYVHSGAYCTKRISEGNTGFERELFELYKEEIKEKTYLLNDNSMSPIFYRNVVRSGLDVHETEWVKDFINTFKPELNKKFRDNYYYYCLALYEFNMKNFETSLELISKIKYDEIYMKLNSKTLHIQLLYELGYEDSLIDALESFRHFLNKNKFIPEIRKIPFNNFHKFLNKIISVKNRINKSEQDLIQHNISIEKNLTNKKWLLEKVKSL